MTKFILVILVSFSLLACDTTPPSDSNSLQQETEIATQPVAAANVEPDTLVEILSAARRIPNSTQWFEVIALPNEVYAFWEPGHVDKVNSFLIVGRDKDVLYDTGLGIGSIHQALAEVRALEGHDDKPLMVINSHNHLDHNGGNTEFDEAWIIESEWAVRKLTEGVQGFEAYWAQMTPHAGVQHPPNFDPKTFSIPPFARENIRFLHDGDEVDLGNRKFRVIHATGHSPDGLALYDEENKTFFGGDTFLGDSFLIHDIGALANDLERISGLQIKWHYSSHGSQLIETMQEGRRLAIVRRIINGERSESTTTFAGTEFPLYELEGVSITLAGDFLVY